MFQALATSLAPSIVDAGFSLFSGNKAAKKNRHAGRQVARIYDRNRNDLVRLMGESADQRVGGINTGTAARIRGLTTGTDQRVAGLTSGANILAHALGAASDARGTGIDQALDERRGTTSNILAMFNPYAQQGGAGFNLLAQALGVQGPQAQRAFFAGFQDDPGFDAEMRAGIDAIDASAAGGGSLRSGATLRALQNYGMRRQRSAFQDRLAALAGLGQTGYNAATAQAGVQERAAGPITNLLLARGENRADRVLEPARVRADLQTRVGELRGRQAFDIGNLEGQRDMDIANVRADTTLNQAQTAADLLLKAQQAHWAGDLAGTQAELNTMGTAGGALSGGLNNFLRMWQARQPTTTSFNAPLSLGSLY